MTQQVINVGTVPNDGTGDPLRVAFQKANANFTELYVPTAAPITLAAPATYYVSPGGNDTTGNGSVGAPWATIQHAADWIGLNIGYQAGFPIDVKLLNGTYDGWVFNYMPRSDGDTGSYTFESFSGTPSDVVINSTASYAGGFVCVGQHTGHENLALSNFTMNCTVPGGASGGSGYNPQTSNFGYCALTNITHTNTSGGTGYGPLVPNFIQGGELDIIGGSVSGTWTELLECGGAANIYWFGTFTFVGSPTFTDQIIQITNTMCLNLGDPGTPLTFSGAITGSPTNSVLFGPGGGFITTGAHAGLGILPGSSGSQPVHVREWGMFDGTIYRATDIVQTAAVTLANGANNNIVVASSSIKITGPTGAFSVSGFVMGGANQDGQILQLFNNTNQTMTITNQATSTAANQIETLTAADVVLRTSKKSFATFRYDGGEARWILMSSN